MYAYQKDGMFAMVFARTKARASRASGVAPNQLTLCRKSQDTPDDILLRDIFAPIRGAK